MSMIDQIESSASAQADTAPDWATIERDVLCPLCEYNLRGLVEPRCPECGHQFVWREVLDRSEWEHRWLFEHARQHKLRSLVRTLLSSQFPLRFWNSVRPRHTPKAARLILYWLIVSSIFVWPMGVFRFWNLLDTVVQKAVYLTADRQRLKVSIERDMAADPEVAAWVKTTPGGVDAIVRTRTPIIPNTELLKYEVNNCPLLARIGWQIAIGCFLWPWLTFLSLLLFHWSLRRARIKTVHVLRCAIYSADVLALLVFPLAWLLNESIFNLGYSGYSILGRSIFFEVQAIIWIAITGLITTYRLSIAYRKYLGFHRPVETALASQLIVILALLAMSPWGFVL